jgi:hypothetical protein
MPLDQRQAGPAPAVVPRVAAMQNPLDRWLYHPLAAHLATVLARTPVTPNMVSIGGGLLIVAAGAAYVQPGSPWFAILGLLLHMGWHVLDGADGDLARMTCRTSPVGEIVDGLSDYLGHVILYLTIAAAAFATAGWTIVILVMAAGASRIVQANFHESQRRQYLHWVHDVDWLRTTRAREGGPRALRASSRIYLALADRLAPGDPAIDRALADPGCRDCVRQRLIAAGPAALAGHPLLGANYRTLLLGAAMLAGTPAAYFLYEAVVLNLLLASAVVRARQARRAVLAGLQPPASSVR